MAGIKRFRKITSKSPELNQVQDNLGDALNPLLALPLNRSIYRQALAWKAGLNRFSHGLGRPYLGCIPGPPSVQGVTFSMQPETDPAHYMSLYVSQACNADLTVF